MAGTSEQSSQQSSQQQSQQQQQQSNNQEQQLPDGVDPSFLAALPEDMRDEVIAEQLRSIDDLIQNSYSLKQYIKIINNMITDFNA